MPKPNTIKYSVSQNTGALEKGNFYLGVTDKDYGPSNTTGYYLGLTASEKFVTYNYSGTEINYNISTSDSNFRNWLFTKTSISFSTATQALLWMATQSDYLSINRDYENIVTDGLVFNVDPGFLGSYPRTGTTVYDISPSASYHLSLLNGPVWNSATGGGVLFDGSDDYATFAPFTFSGEWTVEITASLPGPLDSTFRRTLFTSANHFNEFFATTSYNSVIRSDNSTNRTMRLDFNDNVRLALNDVFTWTVVVDSSKLVNGYINGRLVATSSIFLTASTVTQAFNTFGVFSSSRYFNGTLYSGRMYNRGLTGSEVRQNYLAALNRETGVVTDNLLAFIDPRKPFCYSTASNVIRDLSGNGLRADASLVGGATFSTDGRVSILLDGTNDSIDFGTQVLVENLIPTGTTNLTIEIWVNFISMAANEIVVSKGASASAANTTFIMYTGPGPSGDANAYVRFELSNGSAKSSPIGFSGITFNRWYHYTFTYDGTTITGYQNGGSATTTTLSGPLNITSHEVSIGSDTNDANFGNFEVGAFRIYSSALTAEQVLKNYQVDEPFYQYLADTYPTDLKAGYSVRKLRSGYTGSCVRVRNSSNVELDIGFVNDYIDTAALSTHCGAGSGFVVTWYDQIQAGGTQSKDLTQSTLAAQPFIFTSGVLEQVNQKVALRFTGGLTGRFLSCSLPISFGTQSQVFACESTSDTEYMFWVKNSSASTNIYYYRLDDDTKKSENTGTPIFFQNDKSSFTGSTRRELYNYFNTDGARIISVTNVNFTVMSTGAPGPGNLIGGVGTGQIGYDGFYQEILCFASGAESRTRIVSNINNYFKVF